MLWSIGSPTKWRDDVRYLRSEAGIMNATGKSMNRKREQYRRDPALQQRMRDRAKRTAERLSQYPEWRKVAGLRKRVHEIRESLNTSQERTNKLEIKLLNFVEQLIEAEAQWKKVKPCRNAAQKQSIIPPTTEAIPHTRQSKS